MNVDLLPPAHQIATIMGRIYAYGMTTTSGGNLSIREENGDIWITPRGVDKGALTPEDIIQVKPDGSVFGRHSPSVELPFHQLAYRGRPDLRAIVHAHPPALVAFSMVRRVPDTSLAPDAPSICGEVGMAEYGLPGSAELGEKIARAFARGCNTVILENHGVVAGAGSLLQGMTPTNYRLPGGWSLIRTQNFEGSCPDGEWCGLRQGSVTTTRPHSGSRSVEGRYRRDQDEVGWALIGATGDFRELYLSWWEYTESTVRWNDEKFVTHFIKRLPNDQFQEVIVDFMWSGSFNSTTAIWRVEPQGYALTTNLGLDRQFTYPTGRWVQFEVWYKPNRAGSADGFLRLYQDGVPIGLDDTVENVNINGVESMSNCDVTVGGLYTKNIWMMDHPACTVCSKGPGEGTDYCKSAMGWDGFPFANPPACGNPVPEFSQYFDDIIIMKK